MSKLYLATGNKDKVLEIQEILSTPLSLANIEIDEVQSMDLEYVARKKVESAFKQIKKPVIIDDVGVFIEAWNGFPGPFAKHSFEALGYEGILKLLKNEKNRNVRVTSIIAYHDGRSVHIFPGELIGKLATEKRGSNGWGFDPLIIPEGYNKTFAEMGTSQKNKISHRARALSKFKEFLDSKKHSDEL